LLIRKHCTEESYKRIKQVTHPNSGGGLQWVDIPKKDAEGNAIRGWRWTSLGGRYHGDGRLWWRTSSWNPTWDPTWNLNVTDGLRWCFSHASIIQIHEKNCVDWTILWVTDSKLWVRRPQNQCESGIWNLLQSCLIGRWAGCHDDGIKGLLLK
jgi:hypothetical protein